jgi:hypothetical protein
MNIIYYCCSAAMPLPRCASCASCPSCLVNGHWDASILAGVFSFFFEYLPVSQGLLLGLCSDCESCGWLTETRRQCSTQLLAASASVRWQVRERRVEFLSGSRMHGVLTLSLRRCKPENRLRGD